MLISEVLKVKKSIFQLDHSTLVNKTSKASENGGNGKFSDDEEEKFFDVKDESDKEEANGDDDLNDGKELDDVKKNGKGKKDTSWVHKSNEIFKRHDRYDFMERNPLYCGADKTLTYELYLFSKHYHPTVVVFANKLMNVS